MPKITRYKRQSDYSAYLRRYLNEHLEVDDPEPGFFSEVHDLTNGSVFPTNASTISAIEDAYFTYEDKGSIPGLMANSLLAAANAKAYQIGQDAEGGIAGFAQGSQYLAHAGSDEEGGIEKSEYGSKNVGGSEAMSEYSLWDKQNNVYQLTQEFRPISQYGPGGEQEVLEGNYGEDGTPNLFMRRHKQVGENIPEELQHYTVFKPTMGSPASVHQRKRSDLVYGSINKEKIDYSGPFGKIASDLPQFALRKYKSGKVVGQIKKGGKFTGIPIDPAAIEKFAEHAKEILLKNYDRLPIGKGGGEQSGTLRRAVANAKVEWKAENKAFSAVVAIDEKIRRPARKYGATGVKQLRNTGAGLEEGVTVGYYGRRVFFGRKAVKGRPFLRFKMRGQYIASKNVVPSRKDLNIFDFTAQQQSELMDILIQAIPVALKSDIKQIEGTKDAV